MLSLVADTDTQQDTVTFEDFWLLYPRREAKKDAFKAWSKLTFAQQMAACTALVDWRKIFMDREPQFIPLAATWIRGERWEDELPQAVRKIVSSAHVEFAPAKPVEARTAMPEKLREMLAKMRK